MPTVNEFKPALDARDAVALRNALVKRCIYALADSDDPTDFVANTDGQVTIGLGYAGAVFWLDPADTTTAHDGITCIVTSDGYRYKVSDFVAPYSVLAINQTTPPGSPSIGDAYLTSAAPTGAWAGEGEQIAVYTSRGWVFVQPRVGQQIYVADGTSAFFFLDENGDIVVQTQSGPNTIRDGSLIGGQRRFIVESQTVNTPPGSPGLGIYWIVGPSPTGAWSGQAAKIATSYDGSNWTFITPPTGLEAYDKVSGSNFIFITGTGWISAAGAWGKIAYVKTMGSGSTTAPTGSHAGGSVSTGATPTTSFRQIFDNATLTHQASKVGSLLRFTYDATVLTAANSGTLPAGSVNTIFAICLYRDSESSAIDWVLIGNGDNASMQSPHHATFLLQSADALSHVYKIGILSLMNTAGGPARDVTSIAYRTLQVEESL